MTWKIRTVPWLLAGFGLLSLGCFPEDGRDDIVELGPITKVPFAVSDFFTPSGHMGDGAEAGFITMNVEKHCKSPRPAPHRGKCYNFDYSPGTNLWAGAYWVYPSNNWGSRTGRRFKPWEFRDGLLYQRYNHVQFLTAASQDSFRIDLSGMDSASKVYTLTNAVFQIDGPSAQQINGNYYQSTNAPHATLIMEPGSYTATLQPGWSLTSMEMGMPVAAAATLVSDRVSFSVARDVTTSTGFDFQVGAETVRIALSTPPVAVEYYAGSIGDTAVLRIACPEPGTRCEHRDSVSTSSSQRSQDVTREWMPVSLGLLIAPPCVWNSAGEKPSFAPRRDDPATPINDVGIVPCPVGTVDGNGEVAICDGAFTGAMNADGTIACCAAGEPTRVNPTDPWACPGGETNPVIPGKWQNANDIQSWIIGGFGWAVSYGEFEAQAAVVAGNTMAGEQPVVPANLPPTNIYIDDIIWTFAEAAP